MPAEIIHILGPGATELAASLSSNSVADWAFFGSDVAPDQASAEPPAAVLLTQDALKSDPRVQKLVNGHPVSRRPGMLTTQDVNPATPHKFYPVLSDAIEKAWIRHSLSQFAELGGSEFVDEMIELFNVESTRYITQLEQAIDTSDWATAGRITHTLKSSFGNYGARRLQKLAETMESETNAGKTSELKTHFQSLVGGVNRLRGLLQSMASEKTK